MHRHLTDWIDAKSKLWGYAKRRLLQAAEKYPESFSGKLAEEGPGAALGSGQRQEVEVFTGDALEVAIALHRAIGATELTDRQYETFFCHYVIRAPVKAKMFELGLHGSRYYEILGIVHGKLEKHLAPT